MALTGEVGHVSRLTRSNYPLSCCQAPILNDVMVKVSNSSVVRLLKIYGNATTVKAEVTWPKHVDFRVTPEEDVINSFMPKAYLTVSLDGISVPSGSGRA